METFLIWLIVGVGLLLAEFVVSGFFIFFFGIGAIIVGLLDFFFVAVSTAWWMLIWAVVSLVFFGFCRRFFPQIFRGSSKNEEQNIAIETDSVAGAVAVVTEKITSNVPGKVDFRGSVWEARANKEIAVGTQVKIVKRENITLIVEEL